MSWRRLALALVGLAVIVGGVIIVTRRGENCDPTARMHVEGPAELRETPDGLSVIVSSEEGFTVGALVWILRIGDTEFALSRYPDFSLNRIEFPIPEEAVSRFQDGDGLGMRYGNPTTQGGSSFAAWFPAEANLERTDGFAVLRVSDDCSPP